MNELLPHQSSFARSGDGRLVDVFEVDNGKACNCKCLTCGGALVARQGQINVWHFAHLAATEPITCRWAAETALHIAAKEILAEEKSIMTPAADITVSRKASSGEVVTQRIIVPAIRVDLGSVELERVISTIKPDVLATASDGHSQLIIEITITNGLDAVKRKKLVQLGISAIEIDLKHYPRNITRKELKSILCDQVAEKKWAYNKKHEEIRQSLEKEVAALVGELDLNYLTQIKQKEQKWVSKPESDWQPREYDPERSGRCITYEMRSGGCVAVDAIPVDDMVAITTLDCQPDIPAALAARFDDSQSNTGVIRIHKDRLSELLIYLGSMSKSVRN